MPIAHESRTIYIGIVVLGSIVLGTRLWFIVDSPLQTPDFFLLILAGSLVIYSLIRTFRPRVVVAVYAENLVVYDRAASRTLRYTRADECKFSVGWRCYDGEFDLELTIDCRSGRESVSLQCFSLSYADHVKRELERWQKGEWNHSACETGVTN